MDNREEYANLKKNLKMFTETYAERKINSFNINLNKYVIKTV